MLRSIIHYVRSCFCKHEFEKSEQVIGEKTFRQSRVGTKVCLICRRCGFRKTFWKFVN
jgi:hypothetical protein